MKTTTRRRKPKISPEQLAEIMDESLRRKINDLAEEVQLSRAIYKGEPEKGIEWMAFNDRVAMAKELAYEDGWDGQQDVIDQATFMKYVTAYDEMAEAASKIPEMRKKWYRFTDCDDKRAWLESRMGQERICYIEPYAIDAKGNIINEPEKASWYISHFVTGIDDRRISDENLINMIPDTFRAIDWQEAKRLIAKWRR
jgi:hypothetical protein